MTPLKRSELAHRLYSAFLAGDRELVENLLAEDFTFTSPYDDHIDKRGYFERCWPNRERMRAIEVRSVAQVGDEVFVLYDARTRDGTTFRNAERLIFDGDRIRAVEVYFGDPPAGIPRERYHEVLSEAQRAWQASHPAAANG